jgi:hypothetical protein
MTRNDDRDLFDARDDERANPALAAKIHSHAQAADELRALIAEARARGMLGAADFAPSSADGGIAREVDGWRQAGRPPQLVAALGRRLQSAASDLHGQIRSLEVVLSSFLEGNTGRTLASQRIVT